MSVVSNSGVQAGAALLAGDYGADAQGLICGYLFEHPPGKLEAASLANADVEVDPCSDTATRGVDAAQALAWLAQPARHADDFVWLHFNLTHVGSMAWLRQHADLPDDFFTALSEGSRSSRIERDADTLFTVINDVTFDFSFDAGDIATLWLSARKRMVITARRKPLRAVDRLRSAVKRGETVPSSVGLLDHLLRDQADELQSIARKAGERVDDIEDQILARRAGEHGAELARLRRLTVRLQRLLAPEPGALARLLSNPPPWLNAQDVQQLREAGDDFGVSLRDISTLQDRIKLLQDEAAARVAEGNNRSLFMLTMVTVLALPINLGAGLLGMNVGGIPLSQHEHGFWIVLLVIAAITAVLAWLIWRRLAPRA